MATGPRTEVGRDAPADEGDRPAPPGGGAAKRPVARVVVAVVVALGVLAGLAWYVVTGRTVGGVLVDAGFPRCGGVQTEQWADSGPGEAPFLRPAIPMAEGMECTVVYRISNPGSRGVRVTGFLFPGGGARGGAGFRVAGIHGIPADELPDDVDAIWSEGVDLPAYGTVDLTVALRFRRNGCASPGLHLSTQPTVTVRYLGRSREIVGPASPVFRGTRDSSCDG